MRVTVLTMQRSHSAHVSRSSRWRPRISGEAVATKEELSLTVLGRKREPYDRSIDDHVSNLRKKLSAISQRTIEIETVRAVGYRLRVTA